MTLHHDRVEEKSVSHTQKKAEVDELLQKDEKKPTHTHTHTHTRGRAHAGAPD